MMTNDERQGMFAEAHAALVMGPAGQSEWPEERKLPPDEYLLRALESHISGERTFLAQYRDLAESTQDPIVKLIMNIVLEDEERHHTLMRQLATRLKDGLYWAHTPDALPSTTPATADADAHEALRRFASSERSSIHELNQLAGQADGLYGGLPTELLEMMALDSQKHEHLLRYLSRRIGGALAAQKAA
jgi:rubrerythrin